MSNCTMGLLSLLLWAVARMRRKLGQNSPKITHNAMDPTPTQCQSQSFHKWPKYLVENHFYTSELICLNLMECLPTS